MNHLYVLSMYLSLVCTFNLRELCVLCVLNLREPRVLNWVSTLHTPQQTQVSETEWGRIRRQTFAAECWLGQQYFAQTQTLNFAQTQYIRVF